MTYSPWAYGRNCVIVSSVYVTRTAPSLLLHAIKSATVTAMEASFDLIA